jgi:hypothetical protein
MRGRRAKRRRACGFRRLLSIRRHFPEYFAVEDAETAKWRQMDHGAAGLSRKAMV